MNWRWKAPCRLQQLLLSFFPLLFLTPAAPAAGSQERLELLLTKGTYAIDRGAYGEAADHLQQARRIRPDDPQLARLHALAVCRADRRGECRQALAEAQQLAPDDARIRYELGRLSYLEGDRDAAAGHLRSLPRGADPDLKEEAERLLARLEGRSPKRLYSLAATAGLQYDSNVTIEPNNPALDGDESDWRAVGMADGRFTLLEREAFSAEAGYSFYQSLHQDLDDFDLQQHTLRLAGRYTITPRLRTDLTWRFDYSRVGEELYGRTHLLRAALHLAHSPRLATELRYSHEFLKYFDTDIFQANSDRSGDSDELVLTGNLRLTPRLGLSLSYGAEAADADVDYWSFHGQRAAVRLTSVWGDVKGIVSAAYEYRRYRDDYPGTGERRHDGQQEYSAALLYQLSPRWNLGLSQVYTETRSNLDAFDYRRSITGLFLGVEL